MLFASAFYFSQDDKVTRLVETVVECEETGHQSETRARKEDNDYSWDRAVIALAYAHVSFRAGWKEITGPDNTPAWSLHSALTDASVKRKWRAAIFGSDEMCKACLYQEKPNGQAVVRLKAALPAKRIHVFVNGRELKHKHDLEQLVKKLQTEFDNARHATDLPGTCGPAYLWDDELAALLTDRYGAGIGFQVPAVGVALPRAATAVIDEAIRDCLATGNPVHVGTCGGMVQSQIGDGVLPPCRATAAEHLVFAPLNKMYSQDPKNFDRTALFVAKKQADRWGGWVRHHTCSTDADDRGFHEFVAGLDVCVWSAGEFVASFVVELLQMQRPKLNIHGLGIVGDLNGFLLNDRGKLVKSKRFDEILKSCRDPAANPLTFRDLVRQGKQVIAVLSDTANRPDGFKFSKVAIARACLCGGYANVYVLGRKLAEQLLQRAPVATRRLAIS